MEKARNTRAEAVSPLRVIGTHGFGFLAAALLGALAIGFAAALLFTSGYLISKSALRPYNVLMVYVPIVLVRAFGFSKAGVQYVERLLAHDASLRAVVSLRTWLFRRLEPLALRWQQRYQSGDLLGLLAEDIEQLQHLMLRIVLPSAAALLLYATGIALLGRFDLMFATLMGVYGAFWLFAVPAAALLLGAASRRAYKDSRAALYRELTDAVLGRTDWLLSGRVAEWLARFNESQRSMAASEHRLRRSQWRWQWFGRLSTAGAVIALALWAAARTEVGLLEPTWIAALALAAFPALEAIGRAGESWANWPEYAASMQRMQQIADEPANTATGVKQTKETGTHTVSQGQQQPMLEVSDVHFAYEPDRPILRGLDLSLDAGQKLAVLGRSGAGKSTLVHLLLGDRLADAGLIKIGGHLISDYDRSAGNQIAVLNQNPYLFDTSVAGNIRIGNPQATDAQLRLVCEQVGLMPLLSTLPDGLDTRMEECGQRFSGGERQRVALARILLQDKPIVILDEPTTGLDPITERALLDTVFTVLTGKTLIWITHHLQAMERMDQIIFIGEGRVTMAGTHESLLQHPHYHKLFLMEIGAQ